MKTKPFKILSIDGGGIKGLYSSTVLKHLEEQFDCAISDHFDMICGTSTGGLIALGLSLKIPASEITSIYSDYGKMIFPKMPKWKALYRQFISGGKYSDKELRKVARIFFGNHVIGDSHNLLCVPSYSMTDGQPCVFKYDHGNLSRDNDTSYVDVALATSAAPTYFPVAEIETQDNKQFIDGGVWANNPTLIGVIEAIKYFVGKGKDFDSIQVLSVSSLNHTKGKPTGWRRKRSFWGWKADLFDTSMNGQSKFTHYVMNALCGVNDIDIEYLRIKSEPISHEQNPLVNLDVASDASLDFLKIKGNNDGLIFRKKPEVAKFFKEKKHYFIK